jgi:beta-glucosidase
MLDSVLQRLSILTIGFSVASTSSAFVTQSQQASSRTIVVDLKNVTGPEDRFFDLSVGSDCSNVKFSNLQLSKTSMHVGDATEVKVDVTNTSSIIGDTVAQVYIHQRYGSASRPVRQLKGFERVSLKPGETRTLKVPRGKEELKYWNPQTREWIVEPSEFDVWAGEDPTASLHADLTVTQ